MPTKLQAAIGTEAVRGDLPRRRGLVMGLVTASFHRDGRYGFSDGKGADGRPVFGGGAFSTGQFLAR